MKSLLRQILILLAIAGLGYGGYAGYERWSVGATAVSDAPTKPRTRRARTVQVKTTLAEKRTLVRKVETVGSARAVQVVEVKPHDDGFISSINFEPGKPVLAGAVLYTLDDEIQKADLVEAKANLTKAKQAMERGKKLKRSRVVAQASVEDLEAAQAAAQAQVSRAERRLADRTIRAPFAGTPGFTKVHLGERVTSSTALVRLDDVSKMLVEFAVPEQYFALATPGLTLTAGTSAWPGRAFKAVLKSKEATIDPVSRSFLARAEIDNSDGALAPGMFMYLTMQLARDGVVMVPEQAITVEGGTSHVFVIADGKTKKQSVTIGGRQPGWVELSAGLKLGEEVVVSGTSKLRAGAKVKVVSGPSAKAGATANAKPSSGQSGKPAAGATQ